MRFDGDPSLIKRDDFDVEICSLQHIIVLSSNKSIVSTPYFESNFTESKIIYVYNELEDVTHLQLAVSIYYDIVYSLVIEDYSLFSQNPHLWVFSALKGLLSIQKAAFIYVPTVQSFDTIPSFPLEKLDVSAIFTRTKTIRRLLTSTEISANGVDALLKLVAFLHCQEQKLKYILIDGEDVEYSNVITSSWLCDHNSYAIRSGCSSTYSNDNVTAIISVFQRPYLKEQLLSMDMGRYDLTRVVIYQSLGYIDYRSLVSKCTSCRYFWSLNYDFKLLFRFIFAFAIPEHFILYYSDDIVPSSQLNQRIINCTQVTRGICGFAGRRIYYIDRLSNNYTQHRTTRPMTCDWVVGLYAGEAHTSRTVFAVKPYTFNYAEDMHISFSNALMCNVLTRTIDSYNVSYKSYSHDQHALYKTEEGHLLRYQTIRYFIENRFVPLERLWRVLGADRGWVLTKDDLYYFKK